MGSLFHTTACTVRQQQQLAMESNDGTKEDVVATASGRHDNKEEEGVSFEKEEEEGLSNVLVRQTADAVEGAMLYSSSIRRHAAYPGWNPLCIPTIHTYNTFPFAQIGVRLDDNSSMMTRKFDLAAKMAITIETVTDTTAAAAATTTTTATETITPSSAVTECFVTISKPLVFEGDVLLFRPHYFIAQNVEYTNYDEAAAAAAVTATQELCEEVLKMPSSFIGSPHVLVVNSEGKTVLQCKEAVAIHHGTTSPNNMKLIDVKNDEEAQQQQQQQEGEEEEEEQEQEERSQLFFSFLHYAKSDKRALTCHWLPPLSKWQALTRLVLEREESQTVESLLDSLATIFDQDDPHWTCVRDNLTLACRTSAKMTSTSSSSSL